MKIQLQNLSLRRGLKVLFENANVLIENNSKAGIIGSNGCGKSSLFKLILGELENDIGDLTLSQNIEIAHVAQEMPQTSIAAIEYVKDGDEEFREIERQIQQAENDNNSTNLTAGYEQLENIDGYSAHSRAARLMNGLGFIPSQENLAVNSFSGGWRMRLNLAKALMCRSDLLLLDEPTNHLDLEAIIWLEDWLKAYDGMVLLISHDRDFLNSICNQILSIENQVITSYSGNYDAFERLKAEILKQQQSMYESQQKQMAHMQKYIDRFRYKASKAKQAQSRIKALEKMEVISLAQMDSPFHFQFENHDYMPDQLLRIEKVDTGYNDKTILNEIDLFLHKGEKIGLLGFNGAGKSTLIKLIANEIKAFRGEVSFAKDLKIGYFAQHQLDQLHLDQSPIQHLKDLDSNISDQEARNYLGGYNFHGAMAEEPIEDFSGGEKARLVLAMVVYEKPQLLLLDEPTNHLDMKMRHAIGVALQSFEGAMILVSHDRHLLSTVCDDLLYIYEGQLKPFDGNINDYYKWANEVRANRQDDNNTEVQDKKSKKQIRQQAADIRSQQKPLRQKIRKIEQQIKKLQSKIDNNEAKLLDETIYLEENSQTLININKQQPTLKIEIEELEEQWFEISEELES